MSVRIPYQWILALFLMEIPYSLRALRVRASFSIIGNIKFPIPGLSVTVPDIGSAGVFADVDLATETDEVDLSLYLQACASVRCFAFSFSSIVLDLISLYSF